MLTEEGEELMRKNRRKDGHISEAEGGSEGADVEYLTCVTDTHNLKSTRRHQGRGAVSTFVDLCYAVP